MAHDSHKNMKYMVLLTRSLISDLKKGSLNQKLILDPKLVFDNCKFIFVSMEKEKENNTFYRL